VTYFAIALALGILTGCIAFAGAQAVLWWTDREARRHRREVMRRHDAEIQAFIRGHYGVTVRPPEDFTRIDGGSGS